MNILVANPHLPKADRSSGDRRLVEMLSMLARHHRVDLYAPQVWDDADTVARYRAALCSVGVNLFPDAWRGIKQALAARLYDVVIVEFWNLAEQLLPAIRRWQPGARVVIDTVDVHYLREEAGIAFGLGQANDVSQKKARELAVYRNADAVVVVTEDDRRALETEGLASPTIIPNIVPMRARRAMPRQPDILFVGGFAHQPNVDGILWFLTAIWPAVRAAVPSAKIKIVGGNAPAELLELKGAAGVEILGYLPNIDDLLDAAAVSIAPLRYGGGMKGKVSEALAAGIPVVTTTCGAQGFGAESGKHLMIADSPDQFAQSVILLLNDSQRAEQIGAAGAKLSSALCSRDSVEQKLDAMIAALADREAQTPWPSWAMKAAVFRTLALGAKIAGRTRRTLKSRFARVPA